MPVLLIDNFDSFVFNLARYVEELGYESLVVRHDSISLEDARQVAPSHVIISPGPMGPAQAGISNAIVRQLGEEVPILGVCLGHQCIGAVHGGRVVRAAPVHGQAWPIHHAGRGLFAELASPFYATRYHSLVVEASTLPASFVPLAWTDADPEVAARSALPWDAAASPSRLLMAFAHREKPLLGVQFHPESIGSEHGHTLLARFLEIGQRYRSTGQWQPEQPTLAAPRG